MQALLQAFEQFARTAKGVRLRRVGIVDERKPARQVIDNRQRFDQHEQNVGRADRVRMRFSGFGLRQARFDVAHGVVAEDADQATAKPRQAGLMRHLEAGLIGRDIGQRICGFARFDDRAVVRAGDLMPVHGQARIGGETDEGITTETFAALHRFK